MLFSVVVHQTMERACIGIQFYPVLLPPQIGFLINALRYLDYHRNVYIYQQIGFRLRSNKISLCACLACGYCLLFPASSPLLFCLCADSKVKNQIHNYAMFPRRFFFLSYVLAYDKCCLVTFNLKSCFSTDAHIRLRYFFFIPFQKW